MNGYMLFTRWPSIQRDSEILRQRVSPQLRANFSRALLAPYLRRFEWDRKT